MPWYRSLPAIVNSIWPTLHRQQAATLALLVELILRQRSLCLADLARGSFVDRDFNTRYQQLWRWTQNERLQSRALRRALAQTALAWRAGHGQYLPIIVDTTTCRQFRLLIAVLPRRRRGVPLLWATYQHGTMRAQVTAFQLAFLNDLDALLAESRATGLTPVLIGDRGFARSAILQWCERHGWAYLVRLPQSRRSHPSLVSRPAQTVSPRARPSPPLRADSLWSAAPLHRNPGRDAPESAGRQAAQTPPEARATAVVSVDDHGVDGSPGRRLVSAALVGRVNVSGRKQHLGLTTVRVMTLAAFDRLLLAWMLALQLTLSVGLKIVTPAHERQLGQPKRLGLVSKAVAFLHRHEHTHAPDAAGRPIDLWAALWAGDPPTWLDLRPRYRIPIT